MLELAGHALEALHQALELSIDRGGVDLDLVLGLLGLLALLAWRAGVAVLRLGERLLGGTARVAVTEAGCMARLAFGFLGRSPRLALGFLGRLPRLALGFLGRLPRLALGFACGAVSFALRLRRLALGFALRSLDLALRFPHGLLGLARGFLRVVVVVAIVVLVRIVVFVAGRGDAGCADEQSAAGHECDQGSMAHENLRLMGAMGLPGG